MVQVCSGFKVFRRNIRMLTKVERNPGSCNKIVRFLSFPVQNPATRFHCNPFSHLFCNPATNKHRWTQPPFSRRWKCSKCTTSGKTQAPSAWKTRTREHHLTGVLGCRAETPQRLLPSTGDRRASPGGAAASSCSCGSRDCRSSESSMVP